MKLLRVLCLFALTLLLAAPAQANERSPFDVVTTMTRNQYFGADINAVLEAQNFEEFFAAALEILAQVEANDFPTRARALAADIARARPDLIGLQEVSDFRLNGQNVGPPFVDHLQETLDALAELGQSYVVAATVTNLSVTLPLDVDGDGIFELVSIADRDVILAREGIPFERLAGNATEGGLCGVLLPSPVPNPPQFLSTPSADGCSYSVLATPLTPIGPFPIQRGFVAIDADVRGNTYRFVNTHLEGQELGPSVQALQAAELVATLDALTPPGRPILLVGDFNSSPVDPASGPLLPPYQQIAGAGYVDAWNRNALRSFRSVAGFTCCQRFDLSNRRSLLDQRIDLIFARADASFLSLGFVSRTRIPPAPTAPNWGSDHAGVLGRLIFWRR